MRGIITHGISGVEWVHYKNPLPEYVYDVYMKYWDDVYVILWSIIERK